jgi:hypothetical protein
MSDAPRTAPDAVSKDVLTAHLEGEAVLLHLGTKQYYRLNETAAAIWKGLEAGLDPASIARDLVKAFEIDAATAEAEVARVLAELRGKGLLAP